MCTKVPYSQKQKTIRKLISLSNQPLVSVIIPVWNSTKNLKCCLDLLARQSYQNFEVIVVNNGEDSSSLIDLVSKFDFCKYAREDFPTSYAARNKGLSLAKGEIVAFTDSDCLPTENWIEQGVTSLTNLKKLGIIGGEIRTFSHSLKPSSIEKFEMLLLLKQKQYVEHWLFAATANVFTYKKIFSQIGYFNRELRSAGDLEWCRRAYYAGFQMKYSHSTIVDHPTQKTLLKFLRKLRRVRGGLFDVRTSEGLTKKEILNHSLTDWPTSIDIKKVIQEKSMGGSEKYKFHIVFLIYKLVLLFEDLRLICGGKSIRS